MYVYMYMYMYVWGHAPPENNTEISPLLKLSEPKCVHVLVLSLETDRKVGTTEVLETPPLLPQSISQTVVVLPPKLCAANQCTG